MNRNVEGASNHPRRKTLTIGICAAALLGVIVLWYFRSPAKDRGSDGLPTRAKATSGATVYAKSTIPNLSRPPLLSELVALAQWTDGASPTDIVSAKALLLWSNFAKDETVSEILANRLRREAVREVARLVWLIDPSRNAARFLYRFIMGWPEGAVHLCKLETFQRHPVFPLFMTAAFREYAGRYPDAVTGLVAELPQRYRAMAFAAIAGVLAGSHSKLANEAFDAWLTSASGSSKVVSDASFSKAFAGQILEAARSNRLPRQTTLDALYNLSVSNPLAACKWAAEVLPAYDPDFLDNLAQGLSETSDAKSLETLLENQALGMREPLRGRVLAAAVGSLAGKSPQAAAIRIESLPDSPLKDSVTENFVQQCTVAPPRDLAAFLTARARSSPELVSKVFATIAKSGSYGALDLLPLLSPEHQAALKGAIQAKWGQDGVTWLQANGQDSPTSPAPR